MLWFSLTGLVFSAVGTLVLAIWSVDFLKTDDFFRMMMCLTAASLSFSGFFWLLARFSL